MKSLDHKRNMEVATALVNAVAGTKWSALAERVERKFKTTRRPGWVITRASELWVQWASTFEKD
jgi:hypothetical protein